MNKLDKQFGEMMRGMKVDSPSSDFTLKVMSRVYAEAAVRPKPVLQDYTPVISKRTWIILVALFIVLIGYAMVFGSSSAAGSTGLWSGLLEKFGSLRSSESSNVLSQSVGFLKSVPAVAYLILIAALALWTLDSVFTNLKHRTTDLHAR